MYVTCSIDSRSGSTVRRRRTRNPTSQFATKCRVSPRRRRSGTRPTFSVILLLLSLITIGNVKAQDYLEAGELGLIGASSGTLAFAGMKVKKLSRNHAPLIRGHLPLELSFQRWLGGDNGIGKRNFLDNKIGSAITPLASGLFLSGVNLIYPRGRTGKDFGQDLFLFLSGIIATKGLTEIAKGIVARERPFYALSDNRSEIENRYDRSFLQNSFFSGHASSAFYSAVFLNIRLRDTMRRRMTKSEYDSWKTVSSTALIGWASFVALSRVHAGKHNLSDVIAGGVVGTLMAELFYGFGEKGSGAGSRGSIGSPAQFRIIIPF